MKNTRKRRTNSEFIKDCNIVHHNFYDYSLVEYTKLHNIINIICPVHGEFKQEANHHIRGRGCPKCAFSRNTKLQKDDTQAFIKKSREIHGDLYGYSKTKYGKNAHEKVILICKYHGEFKISPNSHLSKKCGCLQCSQLVNGWRRSSWKKSCSIEGNTPKLYIIKCFNEEEEFYKIGITCKSLHKRFGCKSQLPYDYEIIKIVESIDSDYIFDLEKSLHKLNKRFKYKPKIYFGGQTECFSSIALIEI